jgi:hypothetical protein
LLAGTRFAAISATHLAVGRVPHETTMRAARRSRLLDAISAFSFAKTPESQLGDFRPYRAEPGCHIGTLVYTRIK